MNCYSFTFKANDGTTDSVPATVTITVTAVNDAPVAIAQSVSTPEDTALPLTLAGTDVEGSSLTYVIVTQPAHGILSGTLPNVTYTPTTNFHGADSFTFKANDGLIESEAPATVTITVTAGTAPSLTANFSASPTNGFAPVQIIFTDSSTTGSGTITNRHWVFGNGTLNTTNTSVTNIYANPGIYAVALTVTNDAGLSSTTNLTNLIVVTVGDGIAADWRTKYFGGDGTTTSSHSCATCDADGTGQSNFLKYNADLDPTNPLSRLVIIDIIKTNSNVRIIWIGGGSNAMQILESRADVGQTSTPWTALITNIPSSVFSTTNCLDSGAATTNRFYRLRAHRLP